MKNNKFIIIGVGLLAITAIAISYYLFAYIPKQREITLRKQTYELCVKEQGETSDAAVRVLSQRVVNGEITKQVMDKALVLLNTKRDEMINNCVEKRLQEYKK